MSIPELFALLTANNITIRISKEKLSRHTEYMFLQEGKERKAYMFCMTIDDNDDEMLRQHLYKVTSRFGIAE